jgi:hypothetical protein
MTMVSVEDQTWLDQLIAAARFFWLNGPVSMGIRTHSPFPRYPRAESTYILWPESKMQVLLLMTVIPGETTLLISALYH